MRNLMLVFVFFTCLNVHSKPLDKSLTLAVYLPMSPPYMFLEDKTQRLTGIIPDVLQRYTAAHGYEFSYILVNRVRAENYLYSGKADVSLLQSEWVQKPEKLLFSKSFYQNGERFYGLNPVSISEKSINEMSGKVICTREFYRYPMLDSYVERGLIKRMNAESEKTQLRMMISKRCDYAYINEWVARYYLKNQKDYPPIYVSEAKFDLADGILAFHPSWRRQITKFNKFTNKLKARGELTKILKKYTN